MNAIWIFLEGSRFFHNMAELKYYNFNVNYPGIDVPTPMHLVDGTDFAIDHWCQQDFLGYFPQHRFAILPGYDIPNDYDASVTPSASTHTAAWNVKPLFYSDSILPLTQGVTDATVVGDKYRWRSTMIDLTLNPQRFQELFKSPALNSHVQGIISKNDFELSGAFVPSAAEVLTTVYSKGLYGDGTVGQTDGRVSVVTSELLAPSEVKWKPQGWNSDEYNNPGPTAVPVLARQVQSNPAYGATLGENRDGQMNIGYRETSPNWTTNDPINLFYEYFPLYRMPTFRPFFYCRIVVFKLKFSQNDYQQFRASQYYQNLFLNSIWWNRFDSSGNPNMSIRTNDFNVNTPCGGTFDLKYNKLLQINPFKNYRFRINLYSTRRRGDPVEIRRNTIFADPDASAYPFFKNAEYCAYLLPPLDVQQDFDAISSLLVSAGSFYDTNNFVNSTSFNNKMNPAYTYGPYNPFSIPSSIQKLVVRRSEGQALRFFPTFLPLCTTKITGRTAYWD
ncbi:capsid protein [Cattle blood-associated circovirus-like virus]|uniref:Capsid protein n=1 Tax=Cattle blood-associated circovirus-like virus TaxID=2077298 RepID=A0A2L0HH16_9VIRU|nr:capsid protein [Cattle blood-associated circovirus-like virus]